jgi:hypothetical protein
MSTFARKFPIHLITDQVLEKNPWFRDMLLHWRPAGDALHRDRRKTIELVANGQMQKEHPEHLRLAIRHGYVNFYRAGQSFAKISFDITGKLQAKIHNKYVDGEQGSGQLYITLNATGLYNEKMGILRKYNGLADLRRWVSNANHYIGDEKQFVDIVVAHNPNTIDLEMALPAYSKKRTAPRMDLVALEKVGDSWKIVFWEAKLVTNPSAVCRGDAPPKVVGQLAQYTHWLRHADHCNVVAVAYHNACRLMVEFHKMAKKFNSQIEELGQGIIAAATQDAPPLLVDAEPRLLIDDQTRNVPFIENGHLKKLRGEPYSLQVQMVKGHHDWALGVHP